ncbi:MAG TPA: M48 family metallopeptidase, partial [Pyrinomonadaceae bacterium]|nr:M48 family metallopeptidase [Pyrinomonadaceae bacterium]
MTSRLSRSVVSLALIAQLGAGASLTALAAQQQPQPAAQTQEQQQQTAPAQQTATTAKPAATSTTPSKPVNKSPLSINENPDLIGKRNINKGIIAKMSGSNEKDVALGRQLSAEFDRQAKFIEDPAITEYVNRVGQNVVLHSDAKVPFTIKVVDSDEVNAFALPGGFFYGNKGLLLAADNEAEVAGVMAHEIAHVAARHAAENQTKGNMMQIGAIVGSIFLGGIPGLIFQNTAGLGMLATFLKFSRGAEEEADRLGVQYLYAAGYDPNSMATMFEKLATKNKKKPGLISKAFATHPQSEDRLAASRALVARFPEHEEYVLSTSEFQRVKAKLLRLSNARATTAGNIGPDGDNSSGRPTLKRRQPTGESGPTGTTPGQPTDTSSPANDAPTLKRGSSSTDSTGGEQKPPATN